MKRAPGWILGVAAVLVVVFIVLGFMSWWRTVPPPGAAPGAAMPLGWARVSEGRFASIGTTTPGSMHQIQANKEFRLMLTGGRIVVRPPGCTPYVGLQEGDILVQLIHPDTHLTVKEGECPQK